MAAWQRGEERAELLERTRSLTQVLARALNATLSYQKPATARDPARLLFQGEPDRVAFVTAAAPFPTATPIAFTAVTLLPTSGSHDTTVSIPCPFDGAVTQSSGV